MNRNRVLAMGVAVFISMANMLSAFAEEAAKPAEGTANVTGNPPPDSPFSRVAPGMKFDEAVAILGKPTSERAYCTGKHHIPFYAGRDRALTEYYYQGQGVVVFYTDVSTFTIARYKNCTPKEATEVSEVHYNSKEPGIAPKDGGETQKEAPAGDK